MKKWLRIAALVALAPPLLLAGAAAWYWPQLPPLDRVTDYQPRQPLQVFTQDGVEIAQFGSERRIFTPIAQTPKLLQDAVLAIEDTQFREHPGISVRGLARAFFANLTGGRAQGASTITQQVARTFFLSMRRTPERKIKEALLALQIENRLAKDQILELYLNQIYLGQRAYGFAAAAQTYFGKPMTELSLAETAMLAGLPQNPIYANPSANAERARKRQLVVLARMKTVGVIDEAQHAAAVAEKLVLRSPMQVDVHAEHVAEMARQQVYELLGEQSYSQGIRVVTSLRAADQRAAHTALRRSLLAYERRQAYRGPEDQEDLPNSDADIERVAAQALKDSRDDEELRLAIVLRASPTEVVAQLASGGTVSLKGEGLRWAQASLGPKAPSAVALRRGSVIRVTAATKGGATAWSIAQWPQAEGAFVSIDPITGRVRALVGGFDFNHRQFNHAINAWRQPGSAFKPFIYSAAFEHGVMPDTLVNDAPLVESDGSPAPWSPANADHQFDGPLTLRDALARSRNPVSARLVQFVGPGAVRDWAARFGFDPARQPDNLTLALGTGSTTPMQLAGAYAVFANGGHRVAPVLVERITDAQGRIIFQAPSAAPLADADRVIPARNAFLTNQLLNEVARNGSAASAQAKLQRPDLFGKTGTTDDAVDAWFAGFQPSLVAVAWIGRDDAGSLGLRESGAALALPAWIESMAQALRGVPEQMPEPPEGVVLGAREWLYSEFAEGGAVVEIGFDVPEAASATAATAPASAASAGVIR